MNFFKFLFLAFFLLFIPQEKNSVVMYREDKMDRIEIYARNTNSYPVTIEVDFELQNLESNRKLPYITELGPGVEKNILYLKKDTGNRNWNYRSSMRYYMGSIYARHNDSFVYKLPFGKGELYRLSQGFDGAFSHSGDLRHALDFQMVEGTAIYAARGGRVVAAEEKNDTGGPSERFLEYANYITIMHDDGTFADYSHLKQNGVSVQHGDEVRKGQLIGYSGATGFTTGPHLHFVVKRARKGGGYVSVPIRFTTKDGIQYLEEGKSYLGY